MGLELSDVDRRGLRNGASWIERDIQRLDEDALIDAWADMLERRGGPGAPETLAVYVHVPYCHSPCSFCMYFMSAQLGTRQTTDYVEYTVERLARIRRRVGRIRASSLYIGGGTPSVLDHGELSRLFSAINDTFDVQGDATMEGHPQNLDADKIQLITGRGINRISIGVQSGEAAVLSAVNRHNPDRTEIARLARLASECGAFVNLDLVIGLPEQTLAGITRDVEWALSVLPRSVTLYRYQPMPQLPSPAGALTYRDLDWRRLTRLALRLGYLPLRPGNANAYCASFLRLVPQRRPSVPELGRRAVAFAHLLRSGAFHRPLPPGARLEHFTGFDVPQVNVLGFGPGAISHLYGHAWYRDDLRPTEANGTASPHFMGTPITPDEELRRAIAADFVAGRRVSRREYRGTTGRDPAELLASLPEGLGEALDSRGDKLRLRPRHAHALDLVRWLVPAPGGHAPTHRADVPIPLRRP